MLKTTLQAQKLRGVFIVDSETYVHCVFLLIPHIRCKWSDLEQKNLPDK